jgi:predicted homoserine dehydrogenase-like protein
MIITDQKLIEREKENDPIKVGVVGAGEMAKGLINQITKHTPGMTVVATFNRTVERVKEVYKIAGIENYQVVENASQFENACAKHIPIITQDIELLIKSDSVDIIVDMTGSIEFSAKLTVDAIENKKDVLSFNAELDATLGPILKHKADKSGVKYSVSEGDQPGVTINLYRFVKSMGFEPLLCGNVKGMLDRYRNPSTQENFAKHWGMSPTMATNFADGTKVSFEQACIGNATGMGVAQRGMIGHESKDHVDNLTHLFDVSELKEMGGIVEYVVGAKPGPGVFVYATTDDPLSVKYLEYNKLGKGPLYSFYIPYHLLFFEIPMSIARIVDFRDDIIVPLGGPVVEVISAAKENLKKGDLLDQIGGYKAYGICENADIARKDQLLPMGLAEGCSVLKDIPKDQEITLDDIAFPSNSLSVKLWKEQLNLFST